ncbi:MAG TPA: 4Fe-4S dicluster domain-containing protein [Bradyrhizobium sp.]|nr:4Fe-4S dicluster domain-containing protein [Bradyrhizobium sp.]
MAKMLMIHADKCTGCRNCELACSMSHEGAFRLQATSVHVYTWEREGFSVPMMCQQCSDAPCVKVCTPNALTRDATTGLVNLNHAKCIGCKMCVQACPFGNAVWDEAANKIHKCDTCGGDPQCAKFCPSHALEWVDDTVATRDRKRAFAAKFKDAFSE